MQLLIHIIHKDNIEAIASIRCRDGIKVAVHQSYIWLTMPAGIAEDAVIKKLPVRKTFLADEHGNLFVPGCRVPEKKMPELTWQALNEFIAVDMPVAAYPGTKPEPAGLQLVKTTTEYTAAALQTTLDVWKQYAETAPGVRLHPLRFAVSEEKKVLILGYPLPSVPGKTFWIENDVLIPSGYVPEIKLAAEFLRQQFNSNGELLVVLNEEGGLEKIDKQFFMPATRSAVRLTTVHND